MTRWRWLTLTPDLNLELTLDSDDPKQIEMVEESAKANGITLVRVEAFDPKPLPSDYAESAE